MAYFRCCSIQVYMIVTLHKRVHMNCCLLLVPYTSKNSLSFSSCNASIFNTFFELDVLALITEMRPVVMVDYGGKMPELQEQLCSFLDSCQKVSVWINFTCFTLSNCISISVPEVSSVHFIWLFVPWIISSLPCIEFVSYLLVIEAIIYWFDNEITSLSLAMSKSCWLF